MRPKTIVPTSKEEVQEWGKRIRNSDTDAYKKLFRYAQKPLLRYAQGFVGNEDSYDILQNVFIKLWDRREKLRSDKSIESLLYTMVRNACLNMLRKTKMEVLDQEISESLSLVGAHEELEASELGSQIRQWISELPIRRKEAFILSRMHGLSHKEIGTIMGLSEKTVNAHILLVLQTLRKKLDALQTNRSA